MNSHLHKYKFESRAFSGHKHKITGITDSMIGIEVFHIHTFFGISSYNGHSHYYTGFTGLPIKTENGHIHKIEGELDLNSMHDHVFKNYTEEEIEYLSSRKLYNAHV
ncbi:YmaF family protein [Acetivibrio cellulolyticus]|uniref:YmaF family protein n=1 Tax=Acetivibrio cellulolyticus TaxID=35830 RepID=UPI0001E2D169|nr:YmaF family protein [Acetivibrio cellulolyticus]